MVYRTKWNFLRFQFHFRFSVYWIELVGYTYRTPNTVEPHSIVWERIQWEQVSLFVCADQNGECSEDFYRIEQWNTINNVMFEHSLSHDGSACGTIAQQVSESNTIPFCRCNIIVNFSIDNCVIPSTHTHNSWRGVLVATNCLSKTNDSLLLKFEFRHLNLIQYAHAYPKLAAKCCKFNPTRDLTQFDSHTTCVWNMRIWLVCLPVPMSAPQTFCSDTATKCSFIRSAVRRQVTQKT